ncbi:MAG: hypothetical protein Q9187_007336 [Circinaria calcarea]
MAKKKDRNRPASKPSGSQDTPKESSAEDILLTDAADAVEDEPDTSPYRTSPCTLIIGPDRVQYTVLQKFLDRFPQLAERCKGDEWNYSLNNTFELPDVDKDSGHTLVHYLYTRSYQTLKLQDLSDDAKNLARYTRSMRLYCIAKQYGLSGLEELSKHHAEIYNVGISFTELLDVAEEVFKKLPDDEVWFADSLKTKMKKAFETDKSVFTKDAFLERIGNVKNLNRTLVKCITAIYHEKDSLTSGKPSEERVCTGEYIDVEVLPSPCDLDRNVEPVTAQAPVTADEPALEEVAKPSTFGSAGWGTSYSNYHGSSFLYAKVPFWSAQISQPEKLDTVSNEEFKKLKGGNVGNETEAGGAPPDYEVWAPSSKKSKKKKLESKTNQMFESDLVLPALEEPVPTQEEKAVETEVKVPPLCNEGFWPASSEKHKKKNKSRLVDWTQIEEAEVVKPALEKPIPELGDYDSGLLVSEDITDSCTSRATHLQEDTLLINCPSCHAFVERVAKRIIIKKNRNGFC